MSVPGRCLEVKHPKRLPACTCMGWTGGATRRRWLEHGGGGGGGRGRAGGAGTAWGRRRGRHRLPRGPVGALKLKGPSSVTLEQASPDFVSSVMHFKPCSPPLHPHRWLHVWSLCFVPLLYQGFYLGLPSVHIQEGLRAQSAPTSSPHQWLHVWNLCSVPRSSKASPRYTYKRD
jgi:hypothetical protein